MTATKPAARRRGPALPPFPRRLRIGHLTYRVSRIEAEINRECFEQKQSYAGVSNCDKQMILVRPAMPHDATAEVLLHEVIHQCLRVTGTDPDKDAKADVEDIEERVCLGVAGVLLRTLRDNPDLVTFLLAEETR